MKISWLGRSSFRLEESTGTVVITDPYHSYVGYEMPPTTADIVTISHGHNDRTCLAQIDGNPTVINRAGAYEIAGVHLLSRKTYNGEKKDSSRDGNLVFKLRMDGVDICHMGDVSEECTAMLVETMMPVNILMIPIGGSITIDAKQAKEYVDRIMPDIVIPMHFKTKDCDLDLDKINDFLDLFEDEDIIYNEDQTVEYDRADFDGDKTKVLVLEKFTN